MTVQAGDKPRELAYFRFSKIQYNTCQTAELKTHSILFRGPLSGVQAEMLLSLQIVQNRINQSRHDGDRYTSNKIIRTALDVRN
jgi:hypothetical protein